MDYCEDPARSWEYLNFPPICVKLYADRLITIASQSVQQFCLAGKQEFKFSQEILAEYSQ